MLVVNKMDTDGAREKFDEIKNDLVDLKGKFFNKQCAIYLYAVCFIS